MHAHKDEPINNYAVTFLSVVDKIMTDFLFLEEKKTQSALSKTWNAKGIDYSEICWFTCSLVLLHSKSGTPDMIWQYESNYKRIDYSEICCFTCSLVLLHSKTSNTRDDIAVRNLLYYQSIGVTAPDQLHQRWCHSMKSINLPVHRRYYCTRLATPEMISQYEIYCFTCP